MATRNGARWVEEQVQSIAAQTGNFDLFLAVCDDGSCDDTLRLVMRSAAAAALPVTVVESDMPGGSAGRNFFRLIDAADLTSVDFVAFADQDDLWNEGKLQRALRRLELSKASGYSAAVTAFWPKGKVQTLSQSPRVTSADYLFEGAGQGCTFVLTAEFMRILKLDLRAHPQLARSIHYHDWTLYALTRSHHGTWCFDDWPCLRYRQHDGNDTGARGMRAGVRKRIQLIRSGWYGHQIQLIATLCGRVDRSNSALPREFLTIIQGAKSLPGRTRLARFVLVNGRRKWLDRAVLIWACLAGHIATRETFDDLPLSK